MLTDRKGIAPLNVRMLPAAAGMTLILCLSGCQEETRPPGIHQSDGTVTTNGPNQAVKDMALLHGDSRLQTDTLPDRIRRLKHEIARGEGVYTPEELRFLERTVSLMGAPEPLDMAS